MSNRKSRNLSLLRDYRVECNESFWAFIKESLNKTPADEEFNFAHSDVMKILVPSPLGENTKQMTGRAKNITDLLPTPPQSIIEFGAAYGNLCNEYLELEPDTEYSIVDFEEMLKFTKVFLEKNNKKVDLYSSEQTDKAIKDYDLFLAWMSVSEMPVEYQEKIFEEFLPRCKYAIIGDLQPQIPVYKEVLTEYYGNCQVLGRLPFHHTEQIILFAERV
tara:strand:- start:8836 stop:9489 length:654 start_codon:yes stop_codon:yes gene_type:complete